MRKTKHIILLTLILIISESCKEVTKTTFANRNLYVFSNDDYSEREYMMSVEMRNETWVYSYENKTDLAKNMIFYYDLKTQTLNFGDLAFEPLNDNNFKIKEFSENEFMFFKMSVPMIDGTGPIIFNKEYGVLAIGNFMAPDLIYLPRNFKVEMAEKVRLKL